MITWTLKELVKESRRYLEEGESARVQWKPNPRQIRYYATLGLMDKPHTDNGKTVWYGPTHLLQLLSIKKLQQNGMKLAEIQRTLAGTTPEQMRRLVGLPHDFLSQFQDQTESHPTDRRDTAFWTARPTAPKETTFELSWRLEIAPGVVVSLSEQQATRFTESERAALARALSETWQAQERKRTRRTP